MSETIRLKRSASLYAFSILFTGIVNFIAIPVLKNAIGSAEFAFFNLYMNLLLVFGYIGSGWLVQSCVRFFPVYAVQAGFGAVFRKMALGSALVTAAVSLLFPLVFAHYRWMLFAFPLGIFLVNLQCITVAWLQAAMQPKMVVLAEVTRSILFLGVISTLGLCNPVYLPLIAWAGWIASYVLSLALMLLIIYTKNLLPPVAAKSGIIVARAIFRKFLLFGLPLSLLTAGSYILFFADRFFLLSGQPAAAVGHYVAVSDMLQKGMGFLLSPLVTAIYPLLARLYEAGDTIEVKRLARKASGWQLAITALAVLGFWVAWPMLRKILGVPAPGQPYFVAGLLSLAGAATWQMNLLFQKPFELHSNTSYLLRTIFVCILFVLVIDWWIIPRYSFIGGSLVFFLSALLYNLLLRRRRPGLWKAATAG